MRGGVSITEAYDFGPEEREIVSKIVEDNLETTKKSNMPFFQAVAPFWNLCSGRFIAACACLETNFLPTFAC